MSLIPDNSLVARLGILQTHVVESNAHGSSMSLELFNLGHLHDGAAHVLQTLLGEIGAGDVLGEG